MSPTQVRTISDYILLSVTYGAACASFLAIRTVHQSSIDYAFQFLTASRLYFCNFCVDNLLSGAHSVQKATQFVDDLKRILQQKEEEATPSESGLLIVPLVLENLLEVLKSSVRSVEFSEDLSQKVLGLV
ncbi:hypothetical protein TNIN_52621 [Trichonephila inaurata madagascariensis]|uniref:Uncharacterized protein n=1 Tax=Trichonephila inaurata madagascariensis TaxID=2747483 RepID=A0A8X7C710_9ARAC|nr:hypothetical protein TNIN_52621 [Trichonephila inaurata madagascariensis]